MRRHTSAADLGLGLAVGVLVPVGLVIGVGMPRFTGQTSWTALLGPIAVVAWCAWGWCMVTLAREVWRRVRVHDLEQGAQATTLDRIAVSLAAAVVAIAPALTLGVSTGGASPLPHVPITAPAPSSGRSGASPSEPPATTGTSPSSSTSLAHSPLTSAQASSEEATSTAEVSTAYQVQEGDSLWSIAEHLYGDGDDWTLLAAANLGHLMDDGRIFTNPSLIYPGWSLATPALATSSPRPSPAPPLAAPPQVPSAPAKTPLAEVPFHVTATTELHAPARAAHTPARRPVRSASSDGAVDLVGVLGGGAVLLGLLARKRSRSTKPSIDDALVEPEIKILSTRSNPMASLTERAVALADLDGVLRAPCLLAVGPDGAQIFEGPRASWRAMPTDLGDEISVAERAPAALISLGETGETSWTVVIPPGSVACFDGDADEIVRTSLDLQNALTWGPLVSVAPIDLARREAHLHDEGELVVSQVAALTDPVPGVAIAALDVDGAPVRVEADSIVLTELGITIPRRSIDPLVLRLAAEPEPTPLTSMAPQGVPDPPGTEPATIPLVRDHGPSTAPGTVLIRLLTAEPRVEGLSEPFSTNRARRCTELLAYLAMHHPDPITGDRLRTRVLGTSTTDAAAKTLFNVTSVARRSLGDDLEGRPHLPPAGRDGLYRLGSSITIDVAEFHRLLNASKGLMGPAERAMLARALELIEGEPMAAALTGYEWFIAEGHRTRLIDAVEEGALRHVTLCLADGDPQAARATLNRVRTTVPYSEALAVAAMEVAAAEGDVGAVTAAFENVSSLVDELAPGSGPSDEIERRFRELVAALGSSEAPQASLAAMEAAPRSTSPSAPAAL